RILSDVGIWFRTEMNAVTQLETLIIGDSQLNCVFGVSVPYPKARSGNLFTFHHHKQKRPTTRLFGLMKPPGSRLRIIHW
ncbi:hypothetical protein M8368_28095, partial [Enterobacter kobei]|nr:hypothetical protein [Enterobacter kobei]